MIFRKEKNMMKKILVALKRKRRPRKNYVAGLSPVGVVNGRIVSDFIFIGNESDAFISKQ